MPWNVDGRKKDGSRMDQITLYHETVESLRLWRALAEALLARDHFDREKRALAAKIESIRKTAGHELRMDAQKDRMLTDQHRKLRNAGEQVMELKDFKCRLCIILREHGLGELIPKAPAEPDPMRPVADVPPTPTAGQGQPTP